MTDQATAPSPLEVPAAEAATAEAPARPRRRGWLRRHWLGLVGGFLILLLAGGLGAAGLAAYYALSLPVPLTADTLNGPPAKLVLHAADGRPFATRGPFRGPDVTYDELPKHLVDAVVAIEDRRFFEHRGVDPMGIVRAVWVNYRAGGIRQGASTITQQLAKMMFLTPEQTLRRKAQEVMLAVLLEQQLSKKEIMTRYLNRAYFGAGAYGISGAAERFFGKKVADLTLPEAAFLAGMVKAPSELSTAAGLPQAQTRAGVVVQAMAEAGFVKQAEAEQARNNPARPKFVQPTDLRGSHFADWVSGQVWSLAGNSHGQSELLVQTTLDLGLQGLAEDTIRKWLEREGAKNNVGDAAMVVMSHDGAVLAMVGGRDYGRSQFNRATQAMRQPGSLFKLFVYLAALDAGYKPDSTVVDEPVKIGDYEPKNYEEGYRGAMPLRSAFAHSVNTVAVRLAQEVGYGRVAEMAADLGITTPVLAVPSTALGTSEATLIDLTRAYAAVAANAARVEPYGVSAVRGTSRAVYAHWRGEIEKPSWKRKEMLDLLTGVVRNGTGGAARLGRTSAGKTGTTQEYRDAWFVGFTADAVVGVWVGNDDNTPMNEVTGSGLPARIWKDFMVNADKLKSGKPVEDTLAEEVAAAPSAPEPTPTMIIEGVPEVVDAGTLMLGRKSIRLVGVEGGGTQVVQGLRDFIGGRRVRCQSPDGQRFRCQVGGQDLSQVVLYSGGARVLPDAPAHLVAAEQMARSAGRGIWQGIGAGQ